MRDTAAALARDWVTLALAGLGITLTPSHEYFGGLLLAFAGAGLAAHVVPEQDRRELWLVVLTGFFCAHLALLVAETWAPTWRAQLVMATAGFTSRFLARIGLRMMGLVEMRADNIFDRLLDRWLPPRNGGPR